MKRLFHYLSDNYLDKKFGLRVRLFNVLAMAGTLISFCMALLGAVNRAGAPNIVLNLAMGCLSFALLTYSRRSGNYQLCYIVTIVAIFLILFPLMFFSTGGYHSGMPAFFVFAVAFTIFMLDGKKAVQLSILEILVYIVLCIVAYICPQTVIPLEDEQAILTDVIVAFVTVSVALGISMFLHFRLYNEQQKRLDEQNRALSQINRMKTEFFASVSHEMKTPLTVISVHVQRARTLLELGRAGDAEKVRESHALAQNEIMRLSRLIDGALRLSSLQELSAPRDRLNMREIIATTAEAYRALLENRGNNLIVALPASLPPITGSPDALVQLLSNLLANANAHTKSGEITVRAGHSDDTLTISVADNGE
ncbi:MAG: HAMP domain-containing histidine kinase, partial [Oscillospiraceae bacterium]|nr:HAMP domain-containing histidine kinase [Oscillospiraceae bacterium]